MSTPTFERDLTDLRRRYACPPWCGAMLDHLEDDEPVHHKTVAEGPGWAVSIRQGYRRPASIELLPPSRGGAELTNGCDFSPSLARSIGAALTRAADVQEFELPVS